MIPYYKCFIIEISFYIYPFTVKISLYLTILQVTLGYNNLIRLLVESAIGYSKTKDNNKVYNYSLRQNDFYTFNLYQILRFNSKKASTINSLWL